MRGRSSFCGKNLHNALRGTIIKQRSISKEIHRTEGDAVWMKKILFALTALLIMLLFAQSALADTLTMPDPLDMGFVMSLESNDDNQYAYTRIYKVIKKENVRDVVLTYLEKLMQYEELSYAQCTTNPSGWIYHLFVAADGFSYDQFTYSRGEWKTQNCCIAILYHPEGQLVEFSYSTDFTLPFNTPTPTAKPTAKPTPKTCSICDGTGKCPDCGGDMWVTEWDWVYVNGSPESQLVTKLCDGVYCYGGSCLKCRDDD